MDQVLAVEAVEDFQRAKALAGEERDLDAAADILGMLYEKTVEEVGDLGNKVAPVAFLYGDVTLRQAVKANNDHVQAEVKKRAEQAQRISTGAAAAKPNEDEDDDDDDEEEEAPVLPREEIETLFEIAWDCLDTCRVIYERMASEASDSVSIRDLRKRLSQVMLRLGDVKFEQGQFEQSITEFEKCLEIRQQDEENSSRDLATSHQYLAMAYEHADTETPNIEHRIKAAVHYAKAQEALRLNRIKLLSVEQGSTSSAAEDTPSSKKKKAAKTRNWISTLTTEQVQLIDEAFDTATSALVPAKSTSEGKETSELCEFIEYLAGKVDDVTWVLTEEALEEERKKEEEAKQEPVEQIGFGSATPVAPVKAPGTTSMTPDQPSAAAHVAAPSAEPNILQPKKRAKITPVPTSADPASTAQ